MANRIVFNEAELDRLFSASGPVADHVRRLCVQVEAAAKRSCPVDTGRLRSSISHEVNAEGGSIVGTIGTNVDYAKYVELGTSNQAAQPFLRPALGAARG